MSRVRVRLLDYLIASAFASNFLQLLPTAVQLEWCQCSNRWRDCRLQSGREERNNAEAGATRRSRVKVCASLHLLLHQTSCS